jgi:serine/threonine-protein kinase
MTVDAEAVPAWLLAEISQDKVFADKYEVESELGFGAAGVVVSARHRVLEQRVAIKFLRSGQENPDAVARFLREARAASRIRNQHVVRIIDASTLSSGIPFLVMEYLDGVDLERMLQGSQHRQLPVQDAIDLILQTCEALAECHGAGIVHRDLKPSNLFCVHGADGLPMIKVLDFGIAKLGTTTIESELPEAAPGSAPLRRVFGSPAYMSPEQFESSSHVDLRSDIWALGVILYEFITGQMPFQETSIYRIRKRVSEDSPRPIRELRRDSPAGLWPVILKCMEKNPSQRYANLADLAKALLPFASTRGRQSVASIVRTVEAPGSDTDALSLQPASGRSSMTPSAHTVLAGRSPRASVIAGLGLVGLLLIARVIWPWLNARLAHETPASSVSAPPGAKDAVGLVEVARPATSSSARSMAELAIETAVAKPPAQRAPSQTPARASNGGAALRTSVSAVPSSNPGPSPDAGVNSATIASSAHSVADVPPTSPVPDAPPAASAWPFPIIEDRKHSH